MKPAELAQSFRTASTYSASFGEFSHPGFSLSQRSRVECLDELSWRCFSGDFQGHLEQFTWPGTSTKMLQLWITFAKVGWWSSPGSTPRAQGSAGETATRPREQPAAISLPEVLSQMIMFLARLFTNYGTHYYLLVEDQSPSDPTGNGEFWVWNPINGQPCCRYQLAKNLAVWSTASSDSLTETLGILVLRINT